MVTGGAGFLGSHLCDRLLADGHGPEADQRALAVVGNRTVDAVAVRPVAGKAAVGEDRTDLLVERDLRRHRGGGPDQHGAG